METNKTQQVRDFLLKNPGSTVTEIYKGTGIPRRDTEPIVCRLRSRGELTQEGKNPARFSMAGEKVSRG